MSPYVVVIVFIFFLALLPSVFIDEKIGAVPIRSGGRDGGSRMLHHIVILQRPSRPVSAEVPLMSTCGPEQCSPCWLSACPTGQDEILLSLTYLRRVRLDRATCECARPNPAPLPLGREGDLEHTDATTHAVGVACGRWFALSCSARCSTISHLHCLGALVTQASPSTYITQRPPDGRQTDGGD